MDREKKVRKSLMKDFLGNISLSRRSFIKASAATGAAVAAGSGISFELKALAASTGTQGQGMGQWLPASCQGCTSWCSTGKSLRILSIGNTCFWVPADITTDLPN